MEDRALELAKAEVQRIHYDWVGERMSESEYNFRVSHFEDDGYFEAILVFIVKWEGYGGGSNTGVAYFRYENDDLKLKDLTQYIEGEVVRK